MDIRDREAILYRPVGNDHDRVVGVLKEVVARNLDVRGERAFEREEPDRAEADLPVELERAGPHRRVIREPEVAGKWGRAEARSRVEAAALAYGVRDDIVRHRVVAAAVDGDAVRQRGVLDRVVV